MSVLAVVLSLSVCCDTVLKTKSQCAAVSVVAAVAHWLYDVCLSGV